MSTMNNDPLQRLRETAWRRKLTPAEQATLQRKAEAGLSSDWEAAAASVNLGGPIAQHRPKSKIVKDIHSLVERLIAQPSRRDAAVEAA